MVMTMMMIKIMIMIMMLLLLLMMMMLLTQDGFHLWAGIYRPSADKPSPFPPYPAPSMMMTMMKMLMMIKIMIMLLLMMMMMMMLLLTQDGFHLWAGIYRPSADKPSPFPPYPAPSAPGGVAFVVSYAFQRVPPRKLALQVMMIGHTHSFFLDKIWHRRVIIIIIIMIVHTRPIYPAPPAHTGGVAFAVSYAFQRVPPRKVALQVMIWP
jgi:hypothetical protein